MSNTAEIARAMATTMENAAIPMYGKKLRLPDRSAIIALLKELRRLFFPAYFGDPQLMALPAENYAIKMGVHPEKSTAENIRNIKRQIQEIAAL